MTRFRKPAHLAVPATGLAALLLSGCTIGIDDRPVPPEDIPSVSLAAAPAQTYGAPAGAIVRSELSAPGESSGMGRRGEPDMRWQTGAQPVATGEASLASSDAAEPVDAAEVSAPAEDAASVEPEPAGSEPGRTAAAEAQAPPAFRLEPFVGIGADEARPIGEALRAEAASQGVRLTGGPGDLVLKGYFSSYPEDGQTTVSYVWDVYQPDGTRLNRIGGQKKTGVSASGWRDVPPATLRAVARSSMEELGAWAKRRPG